LFVCLYTHTMSTVPYSTKAWDLLVTNWEEAATDYTRKLKVRLDHQLKYDVDPRLMYIDVFDDLSAVDINATPVRTIMEQLDMQLDHPLTSVTPDETTKRYNMQKTRALLERGLSRFDRLLSDPRTEGGQIFKISEYTNKGCRERYLKSVTLKTIVADPWWIRNMGHYSQDPEFEIFRLFSDRSTVFIPEWNKHQNQRTLIENASRVNNLELEINDVKQSARVCFQTFESVVSTRLQQARLDAKTYNERHSVASIELTALDAATRSIVDVVWIKTPAGAILPPPSTELKPWLVKLGKAIVIHLGTVRKYTNTEGGWNKNVIELLKTDVIQKLVTEYKTELKVRPTGTDATQQTDEFYDYFMQPTVKAWASGIQKRAESLLTHAPNSQDQKDIMQSIIDDTTHILQGISMDDTKKQHHLDLYRNRYTTALLKDFKDIANECLSIIVATKDNHVKTSTKMTTDDIRAINTEIGKLYKDLVFPHHDKWTGQELEHRSRREQEAKEVKYTEPFKTMINKMIKTATDYTLPQAIQYAKEADKQLEDVLRDADATIASFGANRMEYFDGNKLYMSALVAKDWSEVLERDVVPPIRQAHNVIKLAADSYASKVDAFFTEAHNADIHEIGIEAGINATLACIRLELL
jgi:hypothetical protein